MKKRIRALHKLTADMQSTVRNKNITGFESALFSAQLEDRQAELAELETVADQASENRAVVHALEDLLGQKTLENIAGEAHWTILSKKQALEKIIQTQEKQLARHAEIEKALVPDAVMIEAAALAQERGGINSRLVGLFVADQAQAELGPGGELNISFKSKDGSPLLNESGKPMTVADAVMTFENENPTHFRRDAGQGKPGNPWKPETFNLTEQGRILKTNPDLAKRLAAEAGATIFESQAVSKPIKPGLNPWKKETFNLTAQGRLIREQPGTARRLAAEAGVGLDI